MRILFLLIVLFIQWVPSSSFYGYLPHPNYYPIAKPGCVDHCGEVSIPYPFGIGPGCYHDAWYEIVCTTSSGLSKPFLHRLNAEVLDIAYAYDEYNIRQLLTVGLKPQSFCANGSSLDSVSSVDLQGTPYQFSERNTFLSVGCSGIMVRDRNGMLLTACASFCSNNSVYENTSSRNLCLVGIGCCRASLEGIVGIVSLDFYQVASQSCNATVALIDALAIYSLPGNILSSEPVPAVLEWRATYLTNSTFNDIFACSNVTHMCICVPPYAGNAYIPHGHGCQVDCSVYGWTHHCKKLHRMKLVGMSGLMTAIVSVLLLPSGYWLYRFVKRAISLKQRAKYFKKNGGLLLQQQISSSEGVVEKTKLFTISELEKATDNFSEQRILGQGGQGTVYKGMMLDGKIVAIKKSKKVDEDQLEQFINEVIILSQINHRNVVKLLGCCLETEVPLLVYEFIPNGTLYQHIHYPSEDLQVTWKMRLQIAAESAGALAYLHSSSATPIYHRDIKSSNILLDDRYEAKVSDFGISKVINIDQTHVTTCIQGTYGYLDPEYFQSSQFTEKSDVYSFGVVLVELITGKKPVFPTSTGGWMSLASDFLLHIESSLLDDILDKRALEEENKEEFLAVAKLARQCLRRNGKRRPTMKEVAKVLDEIRTANGCNLSQPSYGEMDSSIVDTDLMIDNNLDINMSLPEIQPLLFNNTL